MCVAFAEEAVRPFSRHEEIRYGSIAAAARTRQRQILGR